MDSKNDPKSPAPSLLKSWGKRMAKGNVPMIPVFVGGAWSLQVQRGNKRILRVEVSGKKSSAGEN
ncbi:MAG: hypothetical protein NTX64_14570 [Elusimicrobia bacterium]|nr:hypothetical protein [Elusimicrobiota bacterium]